MKHTKNLIAILLVLTACNVTLKAQDPTPRHEVSASFGLGLDGMPFKGPVDWKSNNGFIVAPGLGYTFWFNQHVGLQTGIVLKHVSYATEYNSGAVENDFTGMLPMNADTYGNTTANIHGTASSCMEKQSYDFIEIPIHVALTWNNVYGNFGFSYAKAVFSSAKYSYDEVRYTITDLPDMGVTMPSPVPVALNTAAEGKVENGSMYRPSFFLFDGEVGYRFSPNPTAKDQLRFGVGLYGRCALNSYMPEVTGEMFSLENGKVSTAQPSTTGLVEKIGYYEFGLRLSLLLGFGKAK